MKRFFTILIVAACAISTYAVDANLQIFYDFGSKGTICDHTRTSRITTTIELFHPDAWGSTFFFVDIDYSLHKEDGLHTPFGAYWEITRSFNFWQNSKAKDLSFHLEYNGGCGIHGNDTILGFPINHTVLVGPEYFLHTPDYKNTFMLQLLFKYMASQANLWDYKDDNGHWVHQKGNQIPLQFTFTWTCKDFCTAPGLTFNGFIDLWGEKISNASRPEPYQSVVFLSEPQLWYSIGQWFKCPGLCIGTEIEFSVNYCGKGFMCNPCLGIKWNFL